MVTLDDFKKFDFQHISTKDFFEIEGLLAQLIIERDTALAQNKEWKRTQAWRRP